jgi:hypothetical protein
MEGAQKIPLKPNNPGTHMMPGLLTFILFVHSTGKRLCFHITTNVSNKSEMPHNVKTKNVRGNRAKNLAMKKKVGCVLLMSSLR